VAVAVVPGGLADDRQHPEPATNGVMSSSPAGRCAVRCRFKRFPQSGGARFIAGRQCPPDIGSAALDPAVKFTGSVDRSGQTHDFGLCLGQQFVAFGQH
jgi:hypothetical protein